jgi:two-component system sensor histidine kinase DesK
VLLFIAFIVFISQVYSRRQTFLLRQEELTKTDHENQLLQKEIEKRDGLDLERERISHDMHDDLGAGISALKLQAEFLKQKVGSQELIKDIDELLKTSEEMNFSMREMLWNLKTENNSMAEFVQYSESYAENFLHKFHCELVFRSHIPDNSIGVTAEWRRNMFLCLKEVLNNIYKHSGAKNVEIIFNHNKTEFIMQIIDDGKGFDPAKASGNGMKSMKRRVTDLNGTLDIKSSAKGSSFYFVTQFDKVLKKND